MYGNNIKVKIEFVNISDRCIVFTRSDWNQHIAPTREYYNPTGASWMRLANVINFWLAHDKIDTDGINILDGGSPETVFHRYL